MNGTLKAIIVAVALIFMGAVLAGCGLFGMDGAWDMLAGNGKLITTQETITGDFTNIDINITRADLELAPSPDDTCYYLASTYDNMFCTAEVENNTLKIGQDDNRQWYQHISVYWGRTSLKVYLPKDTYDQLTISGDTSDVVIRQDFTFENATVTTSTGDIAFSAQVAENLNLSCSTGHIHLQNVSPKALTAAANTGDVRMENIQCESLSVSTTTGHSTITNAKVQAQLSVTSNTGKKHLTDVTCGSLYMKASTGDTELTNVLVAADANLKSSTGDWDFDRFDAASIKIKASTGDVEGTFLSEKIFLANTDTGDVDVPKCTTGGTCEITTDTGDITIDIVS